MSGEDTRFRKKGNDMSRISGTKVSYHNVQLLTSTGLLSLDSNIRGGVAVGTIFTVEEDIFNTKHAEVLVRCFMTEGIANTHYNLLASSDAKKLIHHIPKPPSDSKQNVKIGDEVDIKIAWRYKDHKTNEACSHKRIDLSSSMKVQNNMLPNTWAFNPTHQDSKNDPNCFLKGPFASLYCEIKRVIMSQQLQNTNTHCNKILRVAISSLGSPFWTVSKTHNSTQLLKFLYALRSLMRSSFAVALITIPTTIHGNLQLRDKVRQMSDYVVRMESYFCSKKIDNPLIKDFDGSFEVIKLPVLNSCAYQVLPSDLAYKLRKKYFLIEQLHLPPDEEDPSESNPPVLGCSSSKLEF